MFRYVVYDIANNKFIFLDEGIEDVEEQIELLLIEGDEEDILLFEEKEYTTKKALKVEIKE